jgi:hypothetical protein
MKLDEAGVTEALDDFDLEKLDELFFDADKYGELRIIYEMLKRIMGNTNNRLSEAIGCRYR